MLLLLVIVILFPINAYSLIVAIKCDDVFQTTLATVAVACSIIMVVSYLV